MATSLRDQLQADVGSTYVIEREIGRGGMATVFLARDIRHERKVALKVLDPELAASVGADRFLAEIRTLANLQHPNILPLFDSGAAGGTLYYVMPFVPGETLRSLLERERQLSVDDAVRITTGIAAALEHAHRAGIVHRDLKPENILLADGEPVVADFGIALALDRARSERFTLTGLSLGTPAYMSPEQAAGERSVDARSDIFSLGCMLYEMLAGETPFAAPTAQATIARIVTEPPRPIARASVPSHVSAATLKALEKLPADRWRTAREFGDGLRDSRSADTASVPAMAKAKARVNRVLALGWIPVLAALALVLYRQRPVAEGNTGLTLRFPLAVGDSLRFAPTTPGIPFTISADDRRIAFIGGPAGQTKIMVHRLDDMQTIALAGTEGAIQPALSPDGRSVAFVASGRIARIPVAGGAVETILPLNGAPQAGMDWWPGDTLFASVGSSLVLVPVNGGAPVVLSRPDTAHGETAQWGPHRITKRFAAYTSVSAAGTAASRMATIDLATHVTKISPLHGTTVLGAIDGRVIWVTVAGEIMAAPLNDDGSLGQATRLLEDVMVRPGGAAKATLSPRGTLLYQKGLFVSRLAFVDRTGAVQTIPSPELAYWHPRLSPDGSRIAVSVIGPGTADIWSIDARTGAGTKLTPSDAFYDAPEWSPDGTRVLYRASRATGTTLETVPAGGGAAQPLITDVKDIYGGQFSPDGAWILYRTGDLDVGRRRTIFFRRLGGPEQVFDAPPNESIDPSFSPDGKWIVYTTTASGRPEVFVRPFPGPGRAVQISVNGGMEGKWSHDMRTIFYRSSQAMIAVKVSTTGGVTLGERTQLFSGNYLTDGGLHDYDAASDGKSFLTLQPVDRQTETMMVYGWANEVRARR